MGYAHRATVNVVRVSINLITVRHPRILLNNIHDSNSPDNTDYVQFIYYITTFPFPEDCTDVYCNKYMQPDVMVFLFDKERSIMIERRVVRHVITMAHLCLFLSLLPLTLLYFFEGYIGDALQVITRSQVALLYFMRASSVYIIAGSAIFSESWLGILLFG